MAFGLAIPGVEPGFGPVTERFATNPQAIAADSHLLQPFDFGADEVVAVANGLESTGVEDIGAVSLGECPARIPKIAQLMLSVASEVKSGNFPVRLGVRIFLNNL